MSKLIQFFSELEYSHHQILMAVIVNEIVTVAKIICQIIMAVFLDANDVGYISLKNADKSLDSWQF